MASKKKKTEVPADIAKRSFDMLLEEDQNYLTRDTVLELSTMSTQVNEQLSKIIDRITKQEEKLAGLLEDLENEVIDQETYNVNVINVIKKINKMNIQIDVLKSKGKAVANLLEARK